MTRLLSFFLTLCSVSLTCLSQNVGIGTATPSGKLEVLQTGTTPGLRIQINNAASLTPGVFVVSNAQGGPIEAISTITTGIVNGVAGVVSSTANGTQTSGVSGVLGIAQAQQGGVASAGVRGINNSQNTAGMGVLGYHAGDGNGVYGEGRIGVFGYSTRSGGIGMVSQIGTGGAAALVATYAGTGAGTAIAVQNGRMLTTGTNRFAFRHLVTTQNVQAGVTTVDHPFCNAEPNAILVLTHEYRTPGSENFVTSPVGVRYDATLQKWRIFTETGAGLVVGTTFNIVVINTQ